MTLSINQILIVCLLVVLLAMLVVLGIVAVKGIALMKNVKAFTDEYENLARKAETVIDDARDTVMEGAETFSKSISFIAISSVIVNIVGKIKKITKKK